MMEVIDERVGQPWATPRDTRGGPAMAVAFRAVGEATEAGSLAESLPSDGASCVGCRYIPVDGAATTRCPVCPVDPSLVATYGLTD